LILQYDGRQFNIKIFACQTFSCCTESWRKRFVKSGLEAYMIINDAGYSGGVVPENERRRRVKVSV